MPVAFQRLDSEVIGVARDLLEQQERHIVRGLAGNDSHDYRWRVGYCDALRALLETAEEIYQKQNGDK